MISGSGSIQTPFCQSNPITLLGSVSNLDVVAKTIRITVEFYAASSTGQANADYVNDLVPSSITPVTTVTGFNNSAVSQYIRYGFDFSIAGGATLPVTLRFVTDAIGAVTPEGGPWKVNAIYITAYTKDAQGNQVFCEEGEPKVGLPLSLPNPQTFTFFWAFPQFSILRGDINLSDHFTSDYISGNWLFVPESGSSQPPVITVDGNFRCSDFDQQSFTFNTELLLSPGAKIVIPASSKLTLNQVRVGSTCDALADGIEVASGGTLVGRGAEFTDSRYGVNAHTASSISFTDYCRFTNNYIGLNLDMQDAPFRTNITGFSDVIFETTFTGLKPAYPGMPESIGSQGYCGIFAKNYRDLNLWGYTQFSNMCNGIIGESITGNFGKMYFSNQRPSLPSPVYPNEGYGIKLTDPSNTKYVHINETWLPMSFSNCQTAVSLDGYAGHVKKVIIENCTEGIEWKNSKNRDIVIEKNRIIASRTGIKSFLNEPNVRGSRISENKIDITANQSSGNTSGIQMGEVGWSGFGLQGWHVENNTINMNGGNGIEYLDGHQGYITANTIVNKGTNQPFSGILAYNHSNTGIFTNDIVGAGFLKSTAIESASGFTNAVDCNCVDNTKVGLQFFDMADFSFVEANHVNKHQTGLQLGDEGVSNVYIGNQVHTGNTWDLSYYSGTNNDFGGVHWGALISFNIHVFL